jgi:hypothetical protein
MNDKCRIESCLRARVRDALYCPVHLNDAWANRPPVAHEPEWLRRAREGKLPAKELAAA